MASGVIEHIVSTPDGIAGLKVLLVPNVGFSHSGSTQSTNSPVLSDITGGIVTANNVVCVIGNTAGGAEEINLSSDKTAIRGANVGGSSGSYTIYANLFVFYKEGV